MKKLLIVSAVVLFGFSFVSCDKNCSCQTWAAGVAIGEAKETKLESGKKCKDLNTYIVDSNGENKTGIECK